VALGQWASPHVPRQALTARRWAPGEAAAALVRELGADPGATSLAALCAGGAARPGAGRSTLALLGAQTQARRALSCQKRPHARPQLALPSWASFRPGWFMPVPVGQKDPRVPGASIAHTWKTPDANEVMHRGLHSSAGHDTRELFPK